MVYCFLVILASNPSSETVQYTSKTLQEITEAQNVRGWKGPLWVI